MSQDLDKRTQELRADRGRIEPDASDSALAGNDALSERRPSSRAMPIAAAVVALVMIGLALVILLPRTEVATLSPSPSAASLARRR